MLTFPAPAKLNLTLEVLGKRPDGFHEIRSIMQTVNLCDSLKFHPGNSLIINSAMPGWNAEESLVSRAASLLRETTGCPKGAAVEVEKRIPLVSGLGGDSSDAAATLLGLNKLWELDLTREKLLELAAQLGSDVSFFLHGGTVMAEGRGEIVTPLPPLPTMWAVLIVPDVPRLPGKTKRLYESLKPGHYTDGQITARLAAALREGNKITPQFLFNTFENVAFADFNIRRVYVEHLIKLGAPHVHLAGSGPTLFTLLKDGEQAEDLYIRCKNQGMEAYLVGTGRYGEKKWGINS
ncbi:4-(cytidine 5'-diphospho)-2-C-methyl-D-erythritol kinase [Chloroflexota bacterium]